MCNCFGCFDLVVLVNDGVLWGLELKRVGYYVKYFVVVVVDIVCGVLVVCVGFYVD